MSSIELKTPTPERFYLMYKRYGGELNDMKEYEKRFDIFRRHTFMSFCGGEGLCHDDERHREYIEDEDVYLYKNREDSLKGFMEDCKISWKETNIMLDSVDAVAAYS